MSPFTHEESNGQLRLMLTGELTIQHAGELHELLARVVTPGTHLAILAAGVSKLDAAVLQVLIAAARAAATTAVIEPTSAWSEALQRFGFTECILSTVHSA